MTHTNFGPPSDLPAAAVAQLVRLANTSWDGDIVADHLVLYTVIKEMIHKGTLDLFAYGPADSRADERNPDDFAFWAQAKDGHKSPWEQALCDGLPQGRLELPTLLEKLNTAQGEVVRQHLWEYLEDRGLVTLPRLRVVTKRGRTEARQWLLFGEHLSSDVVQNKDPGETNLYEAYAFALSTLPSRPDAPPSLYDEIEDDEARAKKNGLDLATILSGFFGG